MPETSESATYTGKGFFQPLHSQLFTLIKRYPGLLYYALGSGDVPVKEPLPHDCEVVVGPPELFLQI